MTNHQHNLHLPLPDALHHQLREESVRSGLPATALVREALGDWLARRRRERLRVEIEAYALAQAGSESDLDPVLAADALAVLTEEPWLEDDQITTLDRSKLTRRIGTLGPSVLQAVEAGILAALEMS